MNAKTNETGAPVDVLAVMADAIRYETRAGSPEWVAELREARAAVAELVEAVKAVHYGPGANPDCGFQGCGEVNCRCIAAEAAEARLSAALARIGGGK